MAHLGGRVLKSEAWSVRRESNGTCEKPKERENCVIKGILS